MAEVSTDAIIALQKTASPFRLALIVSLILVPDMEAFFGFAFVNPAITYYTQQNNSAITAPLTDDQVSWFASSMSLSILASSFVGSALVDVVGRKSMLLLATIAETVAWWSLQLSQEFEMLLLNRLLIGVSLGIVVPCSVTFVSDISPIHLRGFLGSLCACVKCLSSLICLVLVAIFEFQTAVLIMSFPSFVFMLGYACIPESPQWLLSRGREEQAARALLMLRGEHYKAETELREMEMLQQAKMEQTLKKGQKVDMFSPEFIKPCFLMVFLASFPMWSGPGLLYTYSLEIATDANLPINPYLFSIACQSSMALGFVLSLYTVAVFPRRPLFITGNLILTLTLAATTFSLIDPGLKETNWIMPISLCLGMLLYGMGPNPVILTLAGEVFPPELKGRGTGAFYAARHITLFAILKMYPSLKANFDLSGIFFGQTLVSVLMLIFAYFFMPETHKLSLTELSLLYKRPEDKIPLLNSNN